MGFPEPAALTDPEYIKLELARLRDNYELLQERLDRQAEGINAIGQNMQWIVDNVSGIFQLLNSPMLMSQIMGQLGGMTSGGGQDESGPGDGDPGA